MRITVQGSHSTWVPPERARLSVSATSESGSREQAMTRASALANELATELKDLTGTGVETVAVQPVRVHEWRPSDQNGRRLAVRVQAQVELEAVFTDFDALAAWTARAGVRDGVRLGWVHWYLTDETAAEAEEGVIGRAIDRARRRALAMARADGAGDVEIEEISDPGLLGEAVADAGAPHGKGVRAMAMMESAPEVDVTPADLEVTATVQVRFTTVDAPPPRRGQR